MTIYLPDLGAAMQESSEACSPPCQTPWCPGSGVPLSLPSLKPVQKPGKSRSLEKHVWGS